MTSRRRWWALSAATACLAAGLAPTAAGTASAAAPASYLCSTGGGPGTRTPVLLVHGFNSAPTTWNSTTQSLLASNQSRTCIALFDYGADSTQWVTDQAISHALALSINTLAAQSATGGGPGKVIIVAHSMGGLAVRCASDPTCSAAGGVTVPGVAAHIAELITFDTPTLGSELKADGATGLEQVLGDSLSPACYATNDGLGKLPGMCSEIRALFTSAAAAAFTPGSAQQVALNKVTMAFPVFTLAGDVGAQTSLFGHLVRNVGSFGDLVVTTTSATAASHVVGGLGGQAVENCGEVDISALPAVDSLPTAAIAAAYAAAFSSVLCFHTDETSSNFFLAPALHQITTVENTLTPPSSSSPVTAADLLSAPVPAACTHQAGTLVNGKQPGIPEIQGEMQLAWLGDPAAEQALLALGDLNGDGIGDAATVLYCNAGGVSWPNIVALYTRGPGGIRLLGSVSLDTVNLPGHDPGENDSVHQLSYANGALHLSWSTEEADDAGADATLGYTATMRWNGQRIVVSDLTAHTEVPTATAFTTAVRSGNLSGAQKYAAPGVPGVVAGWLAEYPTSGADTSVTCYGLNALHNPAFAADPFDIPTALADAQRLCITALVPNKTWVVLGLQQTSWQQWQVATAYIAGHN